MLLMIRSSEDTVVIGYVPHKQQERALFVDFRFRAGVIGLTIALRLQELGHQVLIVAKDFPGPFETIDPQTQINYSSPWAGAHNGWGRDLPEREASPEDWRDHSFALKTFARMAQIHAAYPEAGVTFTKGFEYYDDPPEKIKNLNPEKASNLGIEDFRLLPEDQLPKGVKVGYSFRTWCVNPMVYCSFLLRRFTIQGGKIKKREVRCPAEIFASSEFQHTKFVVNASGTGFGDDKVFITRGIPRPEFLSASFWLMLSLPL